MSFVKEVHVSGELITSTWANKMETGVDEVTIGLDDASRMEVAGGTANALTLVMPSIKAYNVNKLSFVGNVDNGGNATTLNINGLGAKPLYKSGGGNPKIANSKLYTCYYADWANCFFLEASAEGSTVSSHVLAGDTYSSDSEVGALGTMKPHTTALNRITPSTSIDSFSTPTVLYAKPETGYYDGSDSYISLTDPNFIAPNLLSGKTYFGLVGGITIVNPDNGDQTPATNMTGGEGVAYLGVTPNTYLKDINWIRKEIPDLKVSNIVSNKNIFGLIGTAKALPESGLLAGDFVLATKPNMAGVYNGTLTKTTEFKCNATGVFRVTFKLDSFKGSLGTGYYRIYKNGSPYGIQRSMVLTTSYWSPSIGGTSPTFVEDLAFNKNDLIQFYGYHTGDNEDVIYIKGITISVLDSQIPKLIDLIL
jgi:hypothetical protein